MAVVFSNNIIEIAVVQSISSRPVVNVWHMWFDRETGTDTMEAVVEDFRDNWQDHILDIQSTAVALLRFEWRSLDPNDSSVGTVQPNAAKPSAGQDTGQAVPPNVALLIQKNTEDRPRGARDGRCFLAGMPEINVDAVGAIAPASVTGYNGLLSSFYNGISDTSGLPSGDRYPAVLETTVASRTPGPQSVSIGSRRITSLTCDPLVSTQRDRLR